MTEHNLLDETMERSRRIVESVIDISPAVVYIFDIQQRRNVFSNTSGATALGYAHWQVEADGFISSVMHREHWNSFLDCLDRLAGQRDGESAEFECQMRHDNGTWRWFRSRDKVFARNADGSVREIIGTATDITEQKIAEEKNRFIVNLNEALLSLADPKS